MMTTEPQRAMFARYPGLESRLPFIALGDLPTPVVPLHTLAAAIGTRSGAAGLWCKRDDLSSAVYGGNKVRKLEFLLGDALARGCTTILTFGGLGSNHALATAINCRRLGLECIAVLTPEPATEAVRRTLRYHQKLGTHIEVATNYQDIRTLADSLTGGKPDGICLRNTLWRLILAGRHGLRQCGSGTGRPGYIRARYRSLMSFLWVAELPVVSRGSPWVWNLRVRRPRSRPCRLRPTACGRIAWPSPS